MFSNKTNLRELRAMGIATGKLVEQSHFDLARRALVGSVVYPIVGLVMLFSEGIDHVSVWYYVAVVGLALFAALRMLLSKRFDDLYQRSSKRWLQLFWLAALGLATCWTALAGFTLYRHGVSDNGALVLVITVALTYGASVNYAVAPMLVLVNLVVHATGVLLGLTLGTNATPVFWFVVIVLFAIYMILQAQTVGVELWQRLVDSELLRSKAREGEALNLELTESKNAALRANQTKTAILANTSHELRTPLNSILGTSELLLTADLPDKQHRAVETIHRSAESLLSLLNELLDLSRLDSGSAKFKLEVFDLQKELYDIKRAHDISLASRPVELQLFIERHVPKWIRSDALRINQIINNLVGNAIKFTSEGYVRINVKAYRKGEEDWLEIFISDTGTGIPGHKLDSVFEPFTQVDDSTRRQHGGAGLGLAIAKNLVEGLGGTIGVESIINEGTSFYFSLPVEVTAEPKASGRVPSGKIPITSAEASEFLVLIVDDNAANRTLIASQLDYLGYRYEMAASGNQALDALRQNEFDVVLMDCQMPEMDGYAATRHIRSSDHGFADVPVIACTAHTGPEERQRCREAGMDDYLSKPVKLSELSQMVQRWRHGAAAGRQDQTEHAEVEEPVNQDSKLLDEARMQELELIAKQMAPSAIQSIFNDLQASSRLVLGRLGAAISSNQRKEAKAACHELKGMYAGFGLQAASQAYADMETNCDDPTVNLDDLQSDAKSIVESSLSAARSRLELG